MSDQIIDAVMARGLHIDACRVHALVGWVVLQDLPDYPDKFIARLVTGKRKRTAAYHVCASSGMIPAPDEIGLMSISR